MKMKINAFPGKLVLEVYELADFKRGSQKNRIGCPTWIRTMNNASKGRCVTVTPSDKRNNTERNDTKLSACSAQSENHLQTVFMSEREFARNISKGHNTGGLP